MLTLIFYALIAGLLSLAGGILITWRPRLIGPVMTPLIVFAAGAFLGVSFLDILPEALEMSASPNAILIAFLVGFFLFLSLERFLMRYFGKHEHDEPEHEHTEVLSSLLVLGDSLHNFLDGIIIALAYTAEPAFGLITALGIAAHEIPQEIGDFAILLDRGWSKMKVIGVNALSSLFAVAGVIAGSLMAGLFENYLAYLLGGVAGIFTYIAASDLIPEAHHRAGHKETFRILIPFLIGLIAIGYLVSLTEH